MLEVKCRLLLYHFKFMVEGGQSAACDWMSVLLSEQGMHGQKPVLLDWCYKRNGDFAAPPIEIEDDVYEVKAYLLAQPNFTQEEITAWVKGAYDLKSLELLADSQVGVIVPYTEGNMLRYLC